MKNWLLALVVLASTLPVTGQTPALPAEVLIIGTIHTGNKQFSHKTLYRQLEALKPEVILLEISVPYRRVFGLKTAQALKLANLGIEQRAMQDFSRRNPEIPILPYDTAFDYHEHVRQYVELKEALLTKLDQASKTTADSLAYAAYLELRVRHYDGMLDRTLAELNQPETYLVAKQLYSLEEEQVLPLARKYLNNNFLISRFEAELRFWADRNNYMVRQIEYHAAAHPGKRIIVLTGLNHKYFLTEKLKGSGVVRLVEWEDLKRSDEK